MAKNTASSYSSLSEKDFMAQVVQYAKLHKWHVYHTFDSRKSEAGFPDLVMVKHKIVFAELKREGGKLTDAQKAWRDVLLPIEEATDYKVEVHVWYPSNWPQIEKNP